MRNFLIYWVVYLVIAILVAVILGAVGLGAEVIGIVLLAMACALLLGLIGYVGYLAWRLGDVERQLRKLAEKESAQE